ncbi:MAG: DUF2924 domain-containing protein [Pirellulales bacterium]|nr:DUF2924 domain-containing protein [Pirellulales bacterium]
MNVAEELRTLEDMNVSELRERYERVFGESTRSRHKPHLIRRIIWRMQANLYGGLSERALQRARELAKDADIRLTAPRPRKTTVNGTVRVIKSRKVPKSVNLPTPGTVLEREYKGRKIRVLILREGVEYEGTVYRSLSAVAKAVTGSHWNGHLFFGLRNGGKS